MGEEAKKSSFGWKLAYVVGLSSIAFLGGVSVGVAGAARSQTHELEEETQALSSHIRSMESPTRVARRALAWATLINVGCMVVIVQGMRMAFGCDNVSCYV